MTQLAPDVQDSAWAHKYFSLLYPEKIEGFHNKHYQHRHLLRLLQHPPTEKGRYLAAAQYVALAYEVGMPLLSCKEVLNQRNGALYNYWRFNTSNENWSLMRDNGFIGMELPSFGDLSVHITGQFLNGSLAEKVIKLKLLESCPAVFHVDPKADKRIYDLLVSMTVGDLVVACCDWNVLGIGRVKSDYVFDDTSPSPHQRYLEWLSLDEWQLPVPRDAYNGFGGELRWYDNQFALEEHIYDKSPIILPSPPPTSTKTVSPVPVPPLSGLPAHIEAVLQRKGQVILYGPPGTGKTYWAEIAARELAARSAFGKAYEALTAEERTVVNGDSANGGLVRWCCFHPAYGYEDFLEGYRPHAQDGQMLFELRNGIFKTLCEDAGANPNRNYYLLVDEINRGDIPRIFGELLTLLESNKRGKTVVLPLSKTPFAVPKNVYVIGTMNTADRSIALLDAALRRRFGFIELMPDSSTLARTLIEGIPLAAWLDALNARICEHVGRDARNLQIGHSYFLENGRPIRDFAHLSRVLREDIVPLLEEYCYEDYAALEKILGSSLVDGQKQQVRDELFEPARQDELITALLAPCPEITATLQAVMMEAEAQNEAQELDSEAEDDIEAMDGNE